MSIIHAGFNKFFNAVLISGGHMMPAPPRTRAPKPLQCSDRLPRGARFASLTTSGVIVFESEHLPVAEQRQIEG